MIHKQEFLQQHPQFHTGVELFSEDGEKLGKITNMEEDQDHAILGQRRDDLSPWRDEQH